MHALCPPVSQFVLERSPRKLEPGLVEIGTQLVGSRHPDHHWCGVGDESETLFALAKHRLSLAFHRPLPQKCDDQQQQNNYQCDGYDYVASILFPQRGWPIKDHTARRQSGLRNMPALKLSPVRIETGLASVYDGNILGTFARQNAACQLGS